MQYVKVFPTNLTARKKSMERGFSLSEVLVSLLLVVSLSLVLLKQQWLLHRIVNQTKLQAQRCLAANNARERGLSLVELMVALTLALSLITLVIQLYGATFQQFLETETTLNQTSRLHISLGFMRSVIQQAGFTPCLPIAALQTNTPLPALTLDPHDPSVITAYRMADGFIPVSRIDSSHRLLISQTHLLTFHGQLLIADCHHAEILSDFEQHGATLSLKHPLAFEYYPPMYLGEWKSITFGLKMKRLYYYHKHRETLMTNVDTLVWRIIGTLGQTIVHGDLQVEQSLSYPIDIRLRNIA